MYICDKWYELQYISMVCNECSYNYVCVCVCVRVYSFDALFNYAHRCSWLAGLVEEIQCNLTP